MNHIGREREGEREREVEEAFSEIQDVLCMKRRSVKYKMYYA